MSNLSMQLFRPIFIHFTFRFPAPQISDETHAIVSSYAPHLLNGFGNLIEHATTYNIQFLRIFSI